MNKLLTIAIVSLLLFSCSKSGDTVNPSGGISGQGGSLARFTITQDRLYIVDDQKLYTYSLLDKEHPQLKSTVNAGFAVETIYPYTDKLFIGSQSAMYIYSIADPNNPEMLGQASHVRACDPVVANDTLAYVTVRSTNNCGGNVNSLLVYDIKNVMQPQLRNTVPMSGPWGLGLNGKRLYVCNGQDGMNMYNISNPKYPTLIKKIGGETFYDVIVRDSSFLIAMIKGGTALYGIKAGDSVELYSKITQ